MTVKRAVALLLLAVCLLLNCGCKAKEASPQGTAAASYWYYEHLNSTQKEIYNKALNAAENMQTGLIPLGKYSQQDVFLSCRAVLSDRPELFWLPESFALYQNENGTLSIGFEYQDISYLINAKQQQKAQNALSSVVDKINQGLSADMSDFDKELYYHNWLCDNVEYAKDTSDNMVYTAYGALVNGSAVCEGYSRAMQLLCGTQGMDCHIVYGSASNNGADYIGHMWNQIKLDGKYYNLDVTLNDIGDSPSYDFFNVTDKQLKATHAYDRDFSLLADAEKESGNASFNLSLPACTAHKYNYYSVFPKE